MSLNIPLPSQSDVLTQLSQALDTATPEQRLNWMRGLSGKELTAAYEVAQGGPRLELGHFHAAPGEVVIHHGQNSLPAFNAFQKRVVDNNGVLQGYNHQAMAWITGCMMVCSTWAANSAFQKSGWAKLPMPPVLGPWLPSSSRL